MEVEGLRVEWVDGLDPWASFFFPWKRMDGQGLGKWGGGKGKEQTSAKREVLPDPEGPTRTIVRSRASFVLFQRRKIPKPKRKGSTSGFSH